MKKHLLQLIFGCLFLSNFSAVHATENSLATFAGGCFWCMEPPFDKLDGVISTTSGYTDGQTINPTYPQVSAGTTGHTEAIQIKYDASKISYQELLAVFWKNIDPTSKDGQFCDRGTQYRSGIYYHGAEQQKIALASLESLQQNKPFKEPVVTELKAASTFYPAESEHQDYAQRNPIRYKYYSYRCGREQRLEQLWGEAQ